MKTLVVIPTYNEKDNLTKVVEAVLGLPEGLELLIVDDNSPDGTGQQAEALTRLFPGRLQVLHRPGKLGLGSAYIDGFRWGLERGYQAVCEMDADLSHDPADLPRLIGPIAAGQADLAIGSRRVPGGRVIGWNGWRHLMSWGAMTVSRLALGLKTKDVTAGFRCFRAELAAQLLDSRPAAGGYAFQEETLFLCERAGARVLEVPVVFRDRQAGGSKLGKKEIVEFFRVILRLMGQRWRQPKPPGR